MLTETVILSESNPSLSVKIPDTETTDSTTLQEPEPTSTKQILDIGEIYAGAAASLKLCNL